MNDGLMSLIPENDTFVHPDSQSLSNLAFTSGINDAVAEENYENQSMLPYSDPPLDPEELNDYQSFNEEVPEEPKPKKLTSSQKRIKELVADGKKKSENAEKLLLRAEVAEREAKRLEDENTFLILKQQKEKLEQDEYQAKEVWARAFEEGDPKIIQDMNDIISDIKLQKTHKEHEINEIVDQYSKYQNEYEKEAETQNSLQEQQYEALIELSDRRELESPLYDGFLQHHDYLDPRSPNFDSRLAERSMHVKYDLLTELKLNGQADDIGTKDYMEELSRRIQLNLNPRLTSQRGEFMTDNQDPRYQQPVYQKPQQYQNYQQPMQQQRPPQQMHPQQMGYPQQQMGYPQQQPMYPNQGMYPNYPNQSYPQHQSVAPVNRAGYSNGYKDINLNENEREVAEMFGQAADWLTQGVKGRGTNTEELHNNYKQGLQKQYERNN